MEKELAEKAGLAMVDIIDSVVKAKDFAIDQAPDVVEQLLSYNMFSCLAWFLLWAAFLAVSVWGLFKFIALVKEDEAWSPGVMASVFCVAGFLMGAYETSFNGWVKIWLAPKVWLIEYAASLTTRG